MTRYSKDIQSLVNRRGLLNARDGAIIDPVVDEVNGIQWFFKYHKNLQSKFKWVAVGAQQPLVSATGTTLTPTPINTFVAGAASIAAPLDGLYQHRIDAQLGGSGSGGVVVSISYFLDGTTGLETYARQMTLGTQDLFNGDARSLYEMGPGHTFQLAMAVTVLGMISNSHTLKMAPRAVIL